MANSLRKNTVKLVFGPDSKIPSYLDVLKFSLEVLKLSVADIHSIYKDENGGQFYIKLIDEPTFSVFISKTDEAYNFQYEDGTTARCQVDQASRIFRYVRIFNLPPEIEDRDIQYVLGQYGSIRQHVRERFPSELGVNIFTGIRGVHMEIAKEIPANLYIGHIRARIFYEGLKGRCFFCKEEGHMKSDCPKLVAVPSGSGVNSITPGSSGLKQSANQPSSVTKPKSGGGSTGGAGGSGIALGRPSKPIIDNSAPDTPQMTILNKSNTGKVKPLTQRSGTHHTVTSPISELPSVPVGSGEHNSTTSENAADDTIGNTCEAAVAMEDEVSEQQRRATMKRGAPTTESSESDELASDDVSNPQRKTEHGKGKGKNQTLQFVSKLPRNKKNKP